MKFSPQEYVVIESILSQVSVPLKDINKYQRLVSSFSESQQSKDSFIEVNLEPTDISLLHPFFLNSDFHLNEIDFIIDLICKLGMSSLLETSFNKYRSLFMPSVYKYVGTKEVSFVYGGIPSTVCPGDIIKKYFVPFFKKNYADVIQEIDSSEIEPIQTEQAQPPSIELTSPVDHAIHQVFSDLPPIETVPVEEAEIIPTPILEVTDSKLDQPKKYPYKYKDKLLNRKDELNWLYKEELQALSIELGLPSDGKKNDMINRIDELFLTK